MWAKVSLHAKSKQKVLCHPFEIVQELFELKLTTILWHFIQAYFISIFVPNLVEIGPMVWGKTTFKSHQSFELFYYLTRERGMPIE